MLVNVLRTALDRSRARDLIMTHWFSIVLLLHGAAATNRALPPHACEIVETGKHEVPKTREEHARDLVRESTAIALVTVVGFDTSQHRTLILGVERSEEHTSELQSRP